MLEIIIAIITVGALSFIVFSLGRWIAEDIKKKKVNRQTFGYLLSALCLMANIVLIIYRLIIYNLQVGILTFKTITIISIALYLVIGIIYSYKTLKFTQKHLTYSKQKYILTFVKITLLWLLTEVLLQYIVFKIRKKH